MVRARLDERPDHVRVAVRAGLVQRRVPVSVLMIGVDATREDGLDVFQLAVPEWARTGCDIYYGGSTLAGCGMSRRPCLVSGSLHTVLRGNAG